MTLCRGLFIAVALKNVRLLPLESFPMQNVTYHRAESTDIPVLVELRVAFLAEVAGADPNDADLAKALTEYFSASLPSGEFIAYVAEVQNRVVASSGLIFHKHPPSAKNPSGLEAYIMNMYTAPAWRGRGIASALLQELVVIAPIDLPEGSPARVSQGGWTVYSRGLCTGEQRNGDNSAIDLMNTGSDRQ